MPIHKDHAKDKQAILDGLKKLIDTYTAQQVAKAEREARSSYERRGMAFVHATVIDLSDDKKMLDKLDRIVQDRIAQLQSEKDAA